MKLPKGVIYRPRQRRLIDKDQPAIVRISTGEPWPPANSYYQIEDGTFESHVAPYLKGDLEEFHRRHGLVLAGGVTGEAGEPPEVVYSCAAHRPEQSPEGFKLPNITVVANLATSRAPQGVGARFAFGCTMGHFHPPTPGGRRIQEVYEFQSPGLMVLDHEDGLPEMWVAQDGDKVAVPSACHMTLYNLGDDTHPLITLDMAHQHNSREEQLAKECGPILVAYYDDAEAVFTLNLQYINHPFHEAGVRLPRLPTPVRAREVRLQRGTRQDLGSLLYEQLTQNPAVIAEFSRLGIAIRAASPEAVLEPLPAGQEGSRLSFARPLAECADSQMPPSSVYRYFFPGTAEANPGMATTPWADATAPPRPPASRNADLEAGAATTPPLVVVVEGAGTWVAEAYRQPLNELGAEHPLTIFYADDSGWSEPERKEAKPTNGGVTAATPEDARPSGTRPAWASELGEGNGLERSEVYLDKADGDDFLCYRLLRPDAVFVVTPDYTHSALARHWLGKTRVVFVEKPFDSEVKNVEALRSSFWKHKHTEVRGLDHYLYYALPIRQMTRHLDLLGGAIAKVQFYLAEDHPLDAKRSRTLQHGLTLDLLPHLIALLTHFGDVGTIDEITVLEASQYEDLETPFRNETASRVRFTLHDLSKNGFRVPCEATVGKGFSREMKYLEVTGRSGHGLRFDFGKPPVEPDPYPWRSIFCLQGESGLPPWLERSGVDDVPDPHCDGRTLRIPKGIGEPDPLRPALVVDRYRPLFLDLLRGTTDAIGTSFDLAQGEDIVRALDRIWWAIQASQPWQRYPLGKRSPLAPCTPAAPDACGGSVRRPSARISPARPGSEGKAAYWLPRLRRRLEPFRPGINSLHQLSQELRRRVRGSLAPALANEWPLTFVIHGWGTASANVLVEQLLSGWKADGDTADDAIWLVSHPGTQMTPPPDRERMVVLDLERARDRRIHANLVADMVFFAAGDEGTAAQVEGFARRAHAVVIDANGRFAEAALAAAKRAGLATFRWSPDGDGTLEGPDDDPPRSPGGGLETPSAPIAEVDLDRVGSALKECAETHAGSLFRRPRFSRELKTARETYPDHPSWDEDLARLADKHAWPAWAVQCLPRLYIPVAASKVASQPPSRQAIVWRCFLNCLEDGRSADSESMCGGELGQLSLTAAEAALLKEIDTILAENRRRSSYFSDAAFFDSVIDALEQVANAQDGRNPAIGARVRSAQAQFMREVGILGQSDEARR